MSFNDDDNDKMQYLPLWNESIKQSKECFASKQDKKKYIKNITTKNLQI